MQIKSQIRIHKQYLGILFNQADQTWKKSQIVQKHPQFERIWVLFEDIKNHRTLQKLCQPMLQTQKRIEIFQQYKTKVQDIQQLLQKLYQYPPQIFAKKRFSQNQDQPILAQQWQGAINNTFLQGQTLFHILQQKLRVIIKAFQLDFRLPTIEWEKWKYCCLNVENGKAKKGNGVDAVGSNEAQMAKKDNNLLRELRKRNQKFGQRNCLGQLY